MGKITVILSGKGGVGKSTVSVGIASSFCTEGKKVLLIDADEGLRCLDLVLNVSDRLVFDSYDVSVDGSDVGAAITRVEMAEGLYLLAAPAKRGLINKKKFADIIVSLIDSFDELIIDSPAGTDMELYTYLPKTARYVIVTNTDIISSRAAVEISNLLDEIGISNSLLLVNRFDARKAKFDGFNFDTIADETGIRFIGAVPEDFEVRAALNQKRILTFGRASTAFFRITARLSGRNVPFPPIKYI